MSVEGLSIHADVYIKAQGKEFFIGHGPLTHSTDEQQWWYNLADFFHRVAWEMASEGVKIGRPDPSAAATDTSAPRKLTTLAGDHFYEVSPDKFLAAMSLQDARESFGKGAATVTYRQVMSTFPNLREEKIND